MFLTIGKQLKRAREQRHLTLEKAAEATHIRLHYLQALEADDYSVMPSSAQARGFLRNYSGFLGLDLDVILTEIQRQQPVEPGDVSGPLSEVEVMPPPPEPIPSSQAQEPSPSRGPSILARLRQGRPASASKRIIPAEDNIEESMPVEVESSAGRLQDPKGLEADAGSIPTIGSQGQTGAAAGGAAAQEAGEPNKESKARSRAEDGPAQGFPGRMRSFFLKRSPGHRTSPVFEAEEPLQESPAVERTTEIVPAAEEKAIPPAAPEPPSGEIIETAEKIFAEIGAQLRQRRELLSLTAEEVERHTHVRVASILALEEGDFNRLSSAVQTRGMLANYATFLDLDADTLLLRYADALQASHRARHPLMPGRIREPLQVRPNMPPLRTFMAGDVVFGMAVVVLAVALVVWGLDRIFAVPAQPVALPTAPSISEVLAGAGAPTLVQQVTLIPLADTPAAPEEGTTTPEFNSEEIEIVDPNVAVAVTVVAIERTFMRVEVDGEEVFNGRVIPGTAYSYEATATVEILTGNGAALRVTYNGRDLGLLGTFGQVAAFIYTADAIVTPIPATSPTYTATPFITPTPTTTPSPPPATRTPVVPSQTPAS